MKIIFYLLGISIVLLNAIFFFAAHSFLALYYLVWVGGVGGYIWTHRAQVEQRLVAWKMGSLRKFLILGIGMILLEETLAGISMRLATANGVHDIIVSILQFYAFNLLALPGIVIGWYLLVKYIAFSRAEIFVLVGCIGLYAEKVYEKVIAFPLIGALLILPTMFTYMVILAPSILSYRGKQGKQIPRVLRYALGLIVPVIVSIPLIAVLMFLHAQYPNAFPPAGFVS